RVQAGRLHERAAGVDAIGVHERAAGAEPHPVALLRAARGDVVRFDARAGAVVAAHPRRGGREALRGAADLGIAEHGAAARDLGVRIARAPNAVGVVVRALLAA